MDDTAVTDDQVIELRSAGNSYGAIAKNLGFSGARQAYEAFQRALRRQSPAIQTRLRDQELDRLNTLAHRLEDNGRLDAADLERKLAVIDRLRELLHTP